MSGRRSRDKGARTERGIVHALQANGFAAARVPLSGAAGGRFSGDVVLPLMGRDLCLEVKARADGFRELYGWLETIYRRHRAGELSFASTEPPTLEASEMQRVFGDPKPKREKNSGGDAVTLGRVEI